MTEDEAPIDAPEEDDEQPEPEDDVVPEAVEPNEAEGEPVSGTGPDGH